MFIIILMGNETEKVVTEKVESGMVEKFEFVLCLMLVVACCRMKRLSEKRCGLMKTRGLIEKGGA